MAINETTRQRLQAFVESDRFQMLQPQTQERLVSVLGGKSPTAIVKQEIEGVAQEGTQEPQQWQATPESSLLGAGGIGEQVGGVIGQDIGNVQHQAATLGRSLGVPAGKSIHELETVPSATTRAAIQANPKLAVSGPYGGLAGLSGIGGEEAQQAARQATMTPENVPRFQDLAIQKAQDMTSQAYIPAMPEEGFMSPSSPSGQAFLATQSAQAGMPASVAGLAADIVTSPFETLMAVIPSAPGAAKVGQALSETGLAKGMAKIATTDIKLGKTVTSKIDNIIDKIFHKAVKPTTTGKQTFKQISRNKDQTRLAINSIADNSPNLQFADEVGVVSNRPPQNLMELSDSISQTKNAKYAAIDDILKQSDAAGGTIMLDDIADELIKTADSKAIQTANPGLAERARLRAEKLTGQELSAPEIQETLSFLNRKLDAYYKNPGADTLNESFIDALIANNLKKKMDDVVSSAVGTREGDAIRSIKREYSALKSLEKDVARAAVRSANKSERGLIDFFDVLSVGDITRGLAAQNPALVTKGVAQFAIKKWHKLVTDPNKAVATMFKKIGKIKSKTPTTAR